MIAVHLKFCLFGFHLFGLSSHCFCSYLQNKSHCLHKSYFNLFNEFNHLKLHSSGIWANNSIKCVNCILSLYEVRPNRVHTQCTSEYYCNRKSTHKFTKTFRTHIQIDAAALLTHVSKIISVCMDFIIAFIYFATTKCMLLYTIRVSILISAESRLTVQWRSHNRLNATFTNLSEVCSECHYTITNSEHIFVFRFRQFFFISFEI